jgi:hypothetical protein
MAVYDPTPKSGRASGTCGLFALDLAMAAAALAVILSLAVWL